VVENSHATGTVNGSGSNSGGLVGFNSLSRIRGSHATGPVTGKTVAGSLAGRNAGEISQSHATGTVNGAAGSLVGDGGEGTVIP
jgi:hypothetical protein